MTSSLHYAGTLLACLVVAVRLPAARWPARSPRLGVLLWQAIALSTLLSAVGLALALSVAGTDRGALSTVAALVGDDTGRLGPVRTAAAAVALLLAAWVLWCLAAGAVRTARRRRRLRELLRLVAREDADLGASVLDHPGTAAYCVPGRRARVVLSAGTLAALTREQQRAVLAHELAHLAERHDLAVLPLDLLVRVLPRWEPARRALTAVGLLIEMVADDRAAREHGAGPVAQALDRLGGLPGAPAVPGALPAAGTATAVRRDRLLAGPRPLPLPGVVLTAVLALDLVLTPVHFYALLV